MQSGGEQTSIWVAEGVPTPIRILQRDNGEDTYDLRLIEYKEPDHMTKTFLRGAVLAASLALIGAPAFAAQPSMRPTRRITWA